MNLFGQRPMFNTVDPELFRSALSIAQTNPITSDNYSNPEYNKERHKFDKLLYTGNITVQDYNRECRKLSKRLTK